ncbi:hypothetical protein SAMN02745196_01152 [Clostridium collagenovorans DSM 3089]|uniref:Alpha/beta hydrolase family protein n=1 Tax=Clostridium collagenovorans DSM 3089 TaxID=1121306 RepID=A0A1M5V7X7_9CLOT|nr:hypothetical protein [Clostridium collagenovorans]SHH71184.1 hypothetical protein SAMN02745196_01152 [Clostridium collagenovorans DSM 3089]
MKYNSFDELKIAYCELLDQEKFKESIILFEEGIRNLSDDEVEKNFYDIMTEKCWLYCNNGQFDEAIEVFTNLIQNGYICPIDWNFEELKGHERYKELNAKNELLKIEKQKITKFEYVVHVPEGYSKDKKYPLFFSFHGDGENIRNHEKYWLPEWLTQRGFIVVSPQSSKIHYHERFIWIDKAFYNEAIETRKYPYTYIDMHKEIRTCYDSICKEYSIDNENIIVGGYSGGAVASIDIAVSDVIPVKGVVSLCSLKPRSFTKENILAALEKGLKFVFMDGEEDIPMKEVDEMIKELEDHRIPYKYYINKGIGHWYPEDLEEKLARALKFIDGK